MRRIMLDIVQSVIQAFLMRLTCLPMHLCIRIAFVLFSFCPGSQIELNKREFGPFCCSRSTPPIVCKKNAYWPASVPTAVCTCLLRILCLKSFRKAESRLDFELPRPTGPVHTSLEQLTLLLLLTHCSVPIYSIPIRLQCIQCLHNNSVPDYYYSI